MEKPNLQIGLKGTKRLVVTEGDTAAALGSGGLAVFATPMMIRLMERCALESLLPYLAEGASTVGARIDVRHLAAAPLGSSVRCETELVAIDNRRLTFSCAVYDEAGLIGEGVQERHIVDNARFLERAAKRAEARG